MSEAADAQLLQGRAAYAAQALQLVRGARQELLLRSDSLEAALYGGEAFAESVKQFLLGSERARLRLLVLKPQAALRNAAQLIELCRRLSSKVELREPSPEQGPIDPCDWLIADRRALLERIGPEALQSQFWPQEPRRGKTRGEDFDTLWNEAQPSPELRNLSL